MSTEANVASVATSASISQAVESFLTLQLPPDMTALLAVTQLSEVLKVSMDRITPIPHLPNWVLGVYNWRGEILWIVDLGCRLGLQPWHAQERPPATGSVAVLEAATGRAPSPLKVGLIAHRIEDIVTLNPNQLQSPPNALVTEQLAPFLKGHWLDPTGQMLTLLDGVALLDRMPT